MQGNEVFRIITFWYLLAIMATRTYFLRNWYHARKLKLQPSWREFIDTQGCAFIIFSAFVGILLTGGIIMYFLNLPWITWSRLQLLEWTQWLGVILGVTVFPFHLWVYQTLGRGMTISNDNTLTHQLVTDGPYHYVRHPMFITTAFVLISVTLIAADLLLLLGTGGMIALMIIWAPREEQLLVKEFGDQYREYMIITGRFLPKRHGSKQ